MKSKKGGKREGSGRKAGATQIAKSYRIDKDLVEWMNKNVENKNSFVNTVLRNKIFPDEKDV